jgi:flagellar motility protein MotE (MotC chaperone)
MKKFLLYFAIALFPLTACSEQNPIAGTQQAEYERQLQIYDEQAKKASEQQAETDRQLQESAKQMKISIAHQQRMAELLERWEKQTDRYDAILDKWENQK